MREAINLVSPKVTGSVYQEFHRQIMNGFGARGPRTWRDQLSFDSVLRSKGQTPQFSYIIGRRDIFIRYARPSPHLLHQETWCMAKISVRHFWHCPIKWT